MAELGLGITCLKYILFIANFIYMLTGLVLFVLGIILKHHHHLREKSAAYVFIVVGVVTFAVAFVGCCGAQRESLCLLYSFGIALVVVIVIEVVIGIVLFATTSDTVDEIMEKAWKDQANQRTFWDIVEKKEECCGLKGASDYGGTLPESCCKTQPCTTAKAFSHGCLEDFKRIYSKLIQSLATGFVVHAGITLVELFIAMIIGIQIRKKKNEAAA